MVAQFHETGYGKAYYSKQLPELIKAINRVADALEEQNNLTKMGNNASEKKKEDDEIYGIAHSIINCWPDWKKQAYSDNFAISPYSGKLIIDK